MDRIGVIGGTGLYRIDGIEDVREVRVETPFGPPSDTLVTGRLGEVEAVFLPRHGRGHRLLPTEVPYRANLWALKSLGVTRVFSVSAVGSMRAEIALGRPVLVDQFIDLTKHRRSTFFGDGVAAHVSMADPTCGSLRRLLATVSRERGETLRETATYLCMEGPQFSSRAESFAYRAMGVDVIGMTNATEAKLAREAEMCYATIALPTDYDCWYQGHEDVSVGSVMDRLAAATAQARELIRAAVCRLGEAAPCGCRDALGGAILTDRSAIPPEAWTRLGPIVEKYR
jgi:5'-methylthioadenosine phosphorylase